jgi:16S rRNA (guanine1207-N2)-methyltransferase
VLVVEDGDRISRALKGRIHTWRIRALNGHKASTWCPDASVSVACIRQPRERARLRMVVAVAADAVGEGGEIYVAGANDEGAKSAGKVMSEWLTDVKTVDARRHCRVWRGRVATPPGRAQITDWRQEGAGFVDFPGLFAKGKLDPGTEALLRHMPPIAPRTRVLDFACGQGRIGAAIRAAAPEADLWMCDVDALAMEAARENVPGAHYQLSDAFQKMPPVGFGLILANPPVHNGKEGTVAVLEALLDGLPDHLDTGGELRMVTQRHTGVARLCEARERRVNMLEEVGGFRVWRVR